ncbi:MAG TPA: tRNA lysidine(34) synthetase TilS [Streptosporangiaceae bacterium]|nr:tRNA lysidine(34) synthetase TilS [Streptosporangiaceae bacterium]
MRPDPAVAAVRLGVRRSLAGLDPRALVLAACSGGQDSLAMSAALAFEAPRLGLRAGAVTVDHGLQPGSADQAERVVVTLRRLGLDPVHSLRVQVAARGTAGSFPGPEAAARQARYAAIEAAAAECRAAAVMLGHTMDDQAETVLLGLARGSGARSLAGMPGASGRYLRPLLGLRRWQTGTACSALGLEPWEDPQNSDPAYARTRVRQQVLPMMEELLGPGITEALARTADRLRADADALDALTDEAAGRLLPGWGAPAADGGDGDGGDGDGGDGRTLDVTLEVAALAGLPAAIRTRLLKRAAIAAGAPAGSLSSTHVTQLDALVTSWHGQRWSDLPGGIRCQRRYGRLHFTTRS